MAFKFRLKFKKIIPKFDNEAYRIEKILSDEKGKDNEERALCIVENYLRMFIRKKVEKSRKEENIEFSASSCGNEKGRDIKLTLLYPVDLRGDKVYLEIKSSKQGAREHRSKGRMQNIYRTHVVVVNSKRTDKKIARSIFAVLRKEIKRLRNHNKGS